MLSEIQVLNFALNTRDLCVSLYVLFVLVVMKKYGPSYTENFSPLLNSDIASQ